MWAGGADRQGQKSDPGGIVTLTGGRGCGDGMEESGTSDGPRATATVTCRLISYPINFTDGRALMALRGICCS